MSDYAEHFFVVAGVPGSGKSSLIEALRRAGYVGTIEAGRRGVADAVCGSRTTCMVNFWADRTHIPEPKEGWIPIEDLAVMTASHERSSKYKEPSLHFGCWLYATKKTGESEKCSHYPGSKKPPDI